MAEYLGSIGEERPQRTIEKTGPVNVWHLGHGESTLSLSIAAAQALFEKHPELRDGVRNLFSVTETPNRQFPGNSFEIATSVNLSNSTKLCDINSGCTGFVDALSLASRTTVPSLIVCAEAYSLNSNIQQKSIRCLFSDAAAAVYFDPAEYEILLDETVFVPNTETIISKPTNAPMSMDGPKVLTFGLNQVLSLIKSVVQRFPEMRYCFIHQGSQLMVDTVVNAFHETKLVFPSNIRERGNSVSATLPILYSDHVEINGPINNKPILFVGFGVGLYAHALVIKKQ